MLLTQALIFSPCGGGEPPCIRCRLLRCLRLLSSRNTPGRAPPARVPQELRTPLNSVIALSSLALEEQSLPPHVVDYLEGVGTAGRALLWIISQILEYSKCSDEVQARHLELDNSAFHLHGLISDLLSMCREPARARPHAPPPPQACPAVKPW